MLDSISPAENYMFVRRLTNLPLVSQAVSQARQFVDSSAILKYTTDQAAVAVRIIANPIAIHLPVDLVDRFADSKLESLEKSMPIITKSSGELIDDSKAYYSASRFRPAVECVTSAATYGHDTVISLKDYSSNKIDSACSMPRRGLQKGCDFIKIALVSTDSYVEQYLPESELEREASEKDMELQCLYANNDGVMNKDKVQTLSEQLFIISDKVRRRTTTRVMNRMVNSATDIIEKIRLTNNLIKITLRPVLSTYIVPTENVSNMLHTLIASTVNVVYDSSTKMTLEQRLIATARHLTSMLAGVYATSIALIDQSAISPILNKHIADARRFAAECLEALNSNKLPREVLDNAHTSLALFSARIQVLMDNILECRAAKLLVNHPSSTDANAIEEDNKSN